MGSGAKGTVRSFPAATSSRQLDTARKLTPRPAMTKCFIISVESSSIEMRISSSTVLDPATIRRVADRYGVVVDPQTLALDHEATERLRQASGSA